MSHPVHIHCYLDNTAAIRMSGKCGNLTSKRRNDKTNFFWRNTFYTLLYNVIPILITHASHNMTIKFSHEMCLLIQFNNFKCLKKHQSWVKNLELLPLIHHTTVDDMSGKIHYAAVDDIAGEMHGRTYGKTK